MDFRLLYSGRLLGASRKDTRAFHKHDLRREFHPQLRRLWLTDPNLKELAHEFSEDWFRSHPEADRSACVTPEQWQKAGIAYISEHWDRAGFKFVPLVTEKLCLRCKVDILFLRPEKTRYIVEGGDLDGRVKTIFDALKTPRNREETGGAEPQDDETPFFCLFEDDKLISEISVTSDQLLTLPRERDADENDAFMVIHVTLKATHPESYSWAFD